MRLVVIGDHARPGITTLADEFVLVPSEGASMFPSLTATTSVVQAVLAGLVALDEQRARRGFDEAEALWTRFDLFPAEEDQ